MRVGIGETMKTINMKKLALAGIVCASVFAMPAMPALAAETSTLDGYDRAKVANAIIRRFTAERICQKQKMIRN